MKLLKENREIIICDLGLHKPDFMRNYNHCSLNNTINKTTKIHAEANEPRPRNESVGTCQTTSAGIQQYSMGKDSSLLDKLC